MKRTPTPYVLAYIVIMAIIFYALEGCTAKTYNTRATPSQKRMAKTNFFTGEYSKFKK